MEKVRLGVIGCGGIAQFHFGHFEKISEAEVVAVCDLVDDRARAAAERFGATPYTCYAEMLDREDLDAVYVLVHPSAHDGMELMAIEQGCHLFVEKPMTLDMAYANRVKDAITAKNMVSAVGFQCRYADSLPRVKAWLDGQEIGAVVGCRFGGLPLVWWWRRKQDSGGQAVEQSIHNFDILRYLFGEVVSVQAVARRGIMTDIEDYDTDDATSVNLMFESGVIGAFLSGCFSGGGVGKSSFEAFTRRGKLEYGLGGNFRIQEPKMTIEGKAGNDYGQEEDDTFIDAILANDPALVLSPYADACKSLELVLAANESIEKGGVVRLG